MAHHLDQLLSVDRHRGSGRLGAFRDGLHLPLGLLPVEVEIVGNPAPAFGGRRRDLHSFEEVGHHVELVAVGLEGQPFFRVAIAGVDHHREVPLATAPGRGRAEIAEQIRAHRTVGLILGSRAVAFGQQVEGPARRRVRSQRIHHRARRKVVDEAAVDSPHLHHRLGSRCGARDEVITVPWVHRRLHRGGLQHVRVEGPHLSA